MTFYKEKRVSSHNSPANVKYFECSLTFETACLNLCEPLERVVPPATVADAVSDDSKVAAGTRADPALGTSASSSDVSDPPLESPESDLGIIQNKSEMEG
jgi:hypothetical protein